MSKNVSPQSSANAAPLPSLDLARTAFLLDFDGTLVDIAPQPDAVHVSAALRETLAALHATTGGALAIISGRTVHDVESRLSLPGLVIAGVHGAERRYADGGFVRLDASADALANLERELRAALAQLSGQFSGVVLESKGIAFALHYRHAPDAENAVLTVADRLARRYADHVRLQAGKMVVELKPRGASKGDVVHTLATESPFMGRTVLFAGDDLTDESAFAAVNALGGWSIKVGAGPSQAHWRMADPAALRTWLAALVSAPERDGGAA
ncbi:Trehalose-6-phosphate phosphatase [Ralstonia condita]|uniref:Trehalose 6-phosphate phosphatase n=1 Tax=Ralstonia condita TaxID=3058600 RepID=A0ABN9ISN5_9RALS|nr:trehalose-phosphatase [Ralstonia sp. LMG 7141]MDE2201960.1 trehalose-phosphatase [Burkholderiaceae bacterium]CAJ0789651.1 Trehalose-6-phosphate phosphatase [Ralstonia sp. LMG 7141]